MRQLQFRAWKESRKYMAYQGTPDLETLQSFMHHFADAELMEFTGLYDSTKWDDLTAAEQSEWLTSNTVEQWHGRRIFEGDIVASNQPLVDDGTLINVVIFKDGAFMLKHIGDIEQLDYPLYEYQSNYLKVIGNVYESPELKAPQISNKKF